MASVPTDVDRPSDVAGKGPPCAIAGEASMPVPKPFTRMRPASISRRGNRRRTSTWSSPSSWVAMLSFSSNASRIASNSLKSLQRTTCGDYPALSTRRNRASSPLSSSGNDTERWGLLRMTNGAVGKYRLQELRGPLQFSGATLKEAARKSVPPLAACGGR